MSCNYIVSAYKATAVTKAVVGNFTSPTDLNLIQAKGNSIVVNLVTPEGLKPVVEVAIYGRISIMELMRPKGEPQDLLLFMTARYHLAVISYDTKSGEIITRAHGDIKDRVGRVTEGREIGTVDPESRMIALHLYTGLLKVVPLRLDSEDQLTAFNIRLDDQYAIDLQFLHGFDQPTIAYLAEEADGRVLKTVSIFLKDKDKGKNLWKKFTVEPQASMIQTLPLPVGGALVVGAETISYYSQEVQHAIDNPVIKELIVSCVHLVDSTRCLLGDSRGRLLMLFIECEGVENVERVKGLKLELLGEVVSPSTLAYLDNGVVFVGSIFGDPQLVKLLSEANETGGYLEVLESASNIGPVLDMAVVDLEKQGQDVLITCSGHGKDGSLRVVRSGIGINEQASIDLSGVKGVWSIHTGMKDDYRHNCLVVSFVGQTTFLTLSGEEVEEAELDGLTADQQTYHCANIGGSRILQITSRCVRLVNEESLNCVCQWEAPSGKNISTASSNDEQVVVAVGRQLFYLEVVGETIKQITEESMEYEVACVDVTPLGEAKRSDIVTVGLWTDISVRVLRLPTLDPLHTEPLQGDIIPRSVLAVMFGETAYLLVALGDGTLYYFHLEPTTGQLSSSKKVVLGTKPVTLKTFKSADSYVTNVFACSNHPTIIYSNNQKLLFSNVNLKEVNYLCSLSSEAFADCLVVVDDSTLVIGSVDTIQMLHIQSVPLGESPKRIAYQDSSGTFLVASYRVDMANKKIPGSFKPSKESVSTSLGNLTVGTVPVGITTPPADLGDEIEVFTLLLFDLNSLEVIHGYQLCPGEHVLSVTSCPLGAGDGQRIYYIVGTAFVNHTEKEPQQGRVLVLEVAEGQVLRLIHEHLYSGAVYQVVSFNGQLVTAVNSCVAVSSWSEESLSLTEQASYSNSILSLFVKTKGDFILVGDLLRSMRLLRFTLEGAKASLTDIALDVNMNPVFLSAIEMLDDENYIGSDGRHIFICQKNTEAAVEQDLLYMSQPSRMYIGDNINVFSKGSLVMDHPGSGPSPILGKPLLFGTVHGAIGLVGQLAPDTYTILSKLQENVAKVITSVGHINHEVYRSFANEHKTMVTEGFVDGDLVEKFLDLPEAQMNEVVKGIKSTDPQGQEVNTQLSDVIKLVEDLARLH